MKFETKILAGAALAVALANSAHANVYTISADVTYSSGAKNYGDGTTNITLETSDAVTSQGVSVTRAVGTFLGKDVTGVVDWFHSDRLLFSDPQLPFSFDGISLSIAPIDFDFACYLTDPPSFWPIDTINLYTKEGSAYAVTGSVAFTEFAGGAPIHGTDYYSSKTALTNLKFTAHTPAVPEPAIWP